MGNCCSGSELSANKQEIDLTSDAQVSLLDICLIPSIDASIFLSSHLL